MLAAAAVCYLVVGGAVSLFDANWLQAAFRFAAAGFLGSWLLRHHRPRAGRPSRDQASADPGRTQGRDDR